MTSWPWMTGTDVAIADPIDPVNEFDKRPSVKDLIAEHRKGINEIQKELADDPLYDPNKHDSLWILRFLLSHNHKKKTALKAAKHTLQIRKEHALDEKDIRLIPPSPRVEVPALQRYHKYCDDDTFMWCLPDEKRGVFLFSRINGLDQHGVVQNVSNDDWPPTFMYYTEWTHQWLDHTTRTTGRLTKNVRIFDLADMQLSNTTLEESRRSGRAMGIIEDCYPQLLESIFLCNPPSWIRVVWKVFRPLMPKRIISKMDIVNPAKNEKERRRLYQYIDEDKLPVRFGGKYEQWPVDFPLPK